MSTIEIDQQTDAKKIVDAIGSISNEIDKDTANAFSAFKAQSKLSKGLKADITIRGFELTADEPEALGGDNQGPNPVEIVLGAFASCQEIVIKAYAAVLGIKIESIDVSAVGNLDLRGFFNLAEVRPGFQSVHFKTTIQTDEKDEEKLENLKYFAVNKCPVMDMLRNPVPVEGDITVNN